MATYEDFYNYMEPLFVEPYRAITNIWNDGVRCHGALSLAEVLQLNGWNVDAYDRFNEQEFYQSSDEYIEYMMDEDSEFPKDWLKPELRPDADENGYVIDLSSYAQDLLFDGKISANVARATSLIYPD